MLSSWTKILPFFVVKWLAEKRCMRVEHGGCMWAQAYPDALVKVNCDKWRGHVIYKLGEDWRYADNHAKVSRYPNRACRNCGLENTPEGHDGCIPNLPKVVNACCGHGCSEDTYIMMDNGTIIKGKDACEWINKNKN